MYLYQVSAEVLLLEIQQDHADTQNINSLFTSKLGGGLTRKASTSWNVKILRTLETCLHHEMKINVSDVFVYQSLGEDSFTTLQKAAFQSI